MVRTDIYDNTAGHTFSRRQLGCVPFVCFNGFCVFAALFSSVRSPIRLSWMLNHFDRASIEAKLNMLEGSNTHTCVCCPFLVDITRALSSRRTMHPSVFARNVFIMLRSTNFSFDTYWHSINARVSLPQHKALMRCCDAGSQDLQLLQEARSRDHRHGSVLPECGRGACACRLRQTHR